MPSTTQHKKKIVFIVNPISGFVKRKLNERIIEQHLDKSQYDYQILFTEFPGHAIELSRNAAQNGVDIVVAVGGDGSVNEVTRGILGTDTVLGIIPFGSGNGLAHYLHIPFQVGRAIHVINSGKIREIDTLSVNNKVCVSIAGVGFDALVAKKYEEIKSRGFHSYFKIILQEYIKYKPKKYKLNIDGKKMAVKALFISFANSNQFGYNAYIAPHAEIDDGLIDVCIIKKIPLAQLIFLANLLFLKKIEKTKYIQIIQGAEIRLKRKKEKPVNIDGEYFKLSKKLHIEINPKSLKVIVP